MEVLDGFVSIGTGLYILSTPKWQISTALYFTIPMTMLVDPLLTGRMTISLLFWSMWKAR